MFFQVLHDTFRFLVRSHIAFVVPAAVIRHNLDALFNQPIQALLQCRVHGRYCCCKSSRIETVIVDCHFPVFSETVLSAFFILSMSMSILNCFFISLWSVLFPFEPPWGFMDAVYSCRYSFIRRLFLPITLSEKGRICRKCTSKRREQARPPTFAPVKSTRRREGRRKKK